MLQKNILFHETSQVSFHAFDYMVHTFFFADKNCSSVWTFPVYCWVSAAVNLANYKIISDAAIVCWSSIYFNYTISLHFLQPGKYMTVKMNNSFSAYLLTYIFMQNGTSTQKKMRNLGSGGKFFYIIVHLNFEFLS